MDLVIHDLPPEKWARLASDYAGWTVVSEDGPVRPCIGCFGCWNRTPGVCVQKDGYENMGELVHRAGEVHVISRYTYGGFSGFVKGVFDRSLGYVLPHFEVVQGETHHKKRYEEDKPFTFFFYGPALTAAEKESARRYVRAVCANFRARVEAVEFREEAEETAPAREALPVTIGRTVLLVGSMRGGRSNSGKLAKELVKRLATEPEVLSVRDFIKDPDGVVSALETAETLIFALPLYVDGLPAQGIRLMERLERDGCSGGKRVYVLANMGLYESRQLRHLFEAVRQWCEKLSFVYGGGLGVSAGELAGALMEHIPFERGVTGSMAKGMDRLAEAINGKRTTEDIFAQPRAFPRALYIAIANAGWKKMAKANGLPPAELYRRL